VNLRQTPDLFERGAPLGRRQSVARLLGDQEQADVVHCVFGVHLADSPVGRRAFKSDARFSDASCFFKELVEQPERDPGAEPAAGDRSDPA
jgi:hypothetical protein